MRLFVCLLAVAMLIPAAVAAPIHPPISNPGAKRSPTCSTSSGIHHAHQPALRLHPRDKRYNDKVDDFSQKAIDDDLEQTGSFSTASRRLTPPDFRNRKRSTSRSWFAIFK